MRVNSRHIHGIIAILWGIFLIGCDPHNNPVVPSDPVGTIYYTQSEENFPNPERGFFTQHYYESSKLSDQLTANQVRNYRANDYKQTLLLHAYYLTDYMESDISQEFLDRLDQNMEALREGGAKCVIRFAYKSSYSESSKPWDATPEIVARHIEQLKPYLQKNADVIFCMQAGFIGVWGEWYYTDHFTFNPKDDIYYEPRWQVAEQLMDALPSDRQICFRYPALKMRYLRMRGLNQSPLDSASAHQTDIRSRWAAHNDAFVSSDGDMGTFHSQEERDFHAQDTRFIANGGESAAFTYYCRGENALSEMAKYHWTYINMGYHPQVIARWVQDGVMPEMKLRLGYRFVLDKAYMTQHPKADSLFTAQLTLRNIGFAAPVNKRDVELIFVSKSNPSQKFVYAQDADPRYWMEGDTTQITLSATLDAQMKGEYLTYLNLPDPYASLHDKPEFSIRLANENIWEETTGYNLLATITVYE